MDFKERDLHYTMEEFLDEEKANNNFLNFATITGLIIIFLTFTYVLQTMAGFSWGPDLTELMQVLPVIGGILVIIVGFGFLAGNKKRKKNDMLTNDIEKESGRKDEERFNRYAKGSTASSKQEDSEEKNSEEKFDHYRQKASGSTRVDRYALQQAKKLYKSRTDKKLCGVCGGMGKYFDISSTLIRLLFVVAAFMTGGSAILLYIALCIALKKEPPELMDDFQERKVEINQ